jgi:hypothetical protein
VTIAILVPTRGRPERAKALRESIRATAFDRVAVTFYVDDDDPALPAYIDVIGARLVTGPRLGYTATLNRLAEASEATILGAFGDDVLFRTTGWDRIVESTLATPGIAYGDDLIHGKNHPSAVFMSSVIVKALGWLALPATTHQWADDGWKRLGQETGLLRFMPGSRGRAHAPRGRQGRLGRHVRGVFEDARAKADYEGFQGWLTDGLANDVDKVRAAIGTPT